MTVLKLINQIIAFILEICMIVSIGVWAYEQSENKFLKWLFVVFLTSLAVLLWGLYAAPMSQHRLSNPYRVCFELFMLLLSDYLLYKIGHTNLAFILAFFALGTELFSYIYEH